MADLSGAAHKAQQEAKCLAEANKIIELLGGHLHFIRSVGATNLYVTEEVCGLSFRIPNFLALQRINRVKVLLRVDGSYHIKFLRKNCPLHAPCTIVVANYPAVPAARLRAVFTEVTGLRIHEKGI